MMMAKTKAPTAVVTMDAMTTRYSDKTGDRRISRGSSGANRNTEDRALTTAKVHVKTPVYKSNPLANLLEEIDQGFAKRVIGLIDT